MPSALSIEIDAAIVHFSTSKLGGGARRVQEIKPRPPVIGFSQWSYSVDFRWICEVIYTSLCVSGSAASDVTLRPLLS